MSKKVLAKIKSTVLRLLPKNARFSAIYRFRWWGGRESESASGRGSSLAATKRLRVQLPHILRELKCSRLLDLGCGDFHWMSSVVLPCDYVGTDIVTTVIRRNKDRYSRDGIDFMTLNAVVDPIPDDVDVVLCREVLFHLSFKDAHKVLLNIRRSKAKFLLVTQMDTGVPNVDTYTGGFRPLDLTKPPFNLPPPSDTLPDDSISLNRCIGVWTVSDLLEVT